jgi:methyl halide transferase
MTNLLDKSFWDQRWQNEQTGWDLGAASPALIRFFEQHQILLNTNILIPGCGNAWEAAALAERGYANITLCDISPILCDKLQVRFAENPGIHVVCADFFSLSGPFDLVIEQTFFCALKPELRNDYAEQMAAIIKPGGLLAGLWFSVEFPFDGPPFGGNPNDYIRLLQKEFEILEAGPCDYSVKPRQGNEWFIVARKKG